MSTIVEQLADLRAENEELKAQIKEMQEHLTDTGGFPPEWRLTRIETVLLNLLLRRERVSHEAAQIAIYGHASEGPETATLKQHVFNLRGKIKRLNAEIKSVHGVGYAMDVDERRRILEQLETGREPLTLSLRKAREAKTSLTNAI